MRVECVDFITIPTRDVARSVRFYRDVLGLPESDYTEAEVETPNVTLAFWTPEEQGSSSSPTKQAGGEDCVTGPITKMLLILTSAIWVAHKRPRTNVQCSPCYTTPTCLRACRSIVTPTVSVTSGARSTSVVRCPSAAETASTASGTGGFRSVFDFVPNTSVGVLALSNSARSVHAIGSGAQQPGV
jgi:Glyoxalase/Bleomycin resistance protein/Dioxygenase superfamily